MNKNNYLIPNWPAPPKIKAYTTTRKSGNLAAHVEDDSKSVEKNRLDLVKNLDLPQMPFWLNQVHGTKVVSLNGEKPDSLEADAVITQLPNQVCAVLTADCLPILVCDSNGEEVGAIHAGWKGLVAGVIDATLETMKTPNEQLMAWLGPAIGPQAFEINEEIKDSFMKRNLNNQSAFTQHDESWHADIYQLAKLNLLQLGLHRVYGGDFCTYSDKQRFYSYRRAQGEPTGRMASIIWIEGA